MYVILIPEKRLLVLLFDQQNDNKFDLILIWNRRALQPATEPAWQCTKAITKPLLQAVSVSH